MHPTRPISLHQTFAFDLLGKVKNVLIGREISDEIDLLEVVTEILSGISHDELQAVVRS
jgi:hypothetical protein